MKFLFLAAFLAFTLADEYHPRERPSQFKSPRQNMPKVLNSQEGSRTFWHNKARNNLIDILNKSRSNNTMAKNVILFLGDGMGFPTTAAARMFTGDEKNFLSFEKFPYFGLSKTYCVDDQTADSACSATAFAGGVKTNYNALGVNANVLRSNCTIDEEDIVYSITKWAQDAGKGTGIVTTTRITHATPAGFYAHVPRRGYETDFDMNARCDKTNFLDIADQLVHGDEGKKLKVVLGCGRRSFRNSTVRDEENRLGYRSDGRDLVKEWTEERKKEGSAEYVWRKRDLMSVDIEKTDYLLGLFEDTHCLYQQEITDNDLSHQEPSLSEMASIAVKMMQKEDNGYFLLIEGGRIDLAHHSNYNSRAMQETREFANAINIVRQMTDSKDTLLVVTADHSHVMTFNGYPDRFSNILGTAEDDLEGLPYPIVSYGNGPGYSTTYRDGGNSSVRVDLNTVDMRNPSRRSFATVPIGSETHGSEVR